MWRTVCGVGRGLRSKSRMCGARAVIDMVHRRYPEAVGSVDHRRRDGDHQRRDGNHQRRDGDHRRHGLSAQHRREDHRQGRRLYPCPQGQPGQPARRYQAFLHRTDSMRLCRYGCQPPPDSGEEPRPHRNPDHHGDERNRLAEGTPPLARAREHCYGRNRT